MTPVKIKQLRGELGLRAPGSIVSVNDETAAFWIKKGWAEPVTVAQMPEPFENEKQKRKQKKQKPETKEEKFGGNFETK